MNETTAIETPEREARWSPSDCSALVKEVTRFETTDGNSHFSRSSAEMVQKNIEEAKWASERLEEGWSVARILKGVGRNVPDEILDQVTKDSKLVVSHWQCCNEPGYQARYFEPGMSIYVYGNAGSWGGSYGGTMSVADLARYALEKRTILGPNKNNNHE